MRFWGEEVCGVSSHLKAGLLQELHALLEREPEGLWEVLQRLYRELLCYRTQLRRCADIRPVSASLTPQAGEKRGKTPINISRHTQG